MRLFVAVDVPAPIKQSIERNIVDVLRPALEGARWTRPDGRHLTLSFLGNVDDDGVEAIATALRDAARGHRAFDASFGAVGAFPNLRRPRVLWLGVEQGAEELIALAASVSAALEPLGFEPEARTFTPHLTLARFPRPGVLSELTPPVLRAGAFSVDALVLFRSQLHPKGARYTALESVALK